MIETNPQMLSDDALPQEHDFGRESPERDLGAEIKGIKVDLGTGKDGGIRWGSAGRNSVDPGHRHRKSVLRIFQAVAVAFGTDITVGDGKWYFHIPDTMDKMKLVYVHARVITAGTTNTTDIQIANVTQSVDMLSTKVTIDSTETGSNTAATAYVINTANDQINENDVIRVDVDAVSTTAPKGFIITLEFELRL